MSTIIINNKEDTTMTYEEKQEIYKSACYGMTAEEIADVNEMTVSAVKSVLANTEELEEVREDLKDMGVIA